MYLDGRRHIVSILAAFSVAASSAPVHLVDEAPVSIKRISADIIPVDFGRVSFGDIQLTASGSLLRVCNILASKTVFEGMGVDDILGGGG